MKPSIEFIHGIKEKILPIVKLTKSKNGSTGTATFIFVNPDIFTQLAYSSINVITLIWENNIIFTNDLEILFKNGKPFLLKAIFIFKTSQELFHFLHFMRIYSKETGLFFSEEN